MTVYIDVAIDVLSCDRVFVCKLCSNLWCIYGVRICVLIQSLPFCIYICLFFLHAAFNSSLCRSSNVFSSSNCFLREDGLLLHQLATNMVAESSMESGAALVGKWALPLVGSMSQCCYEKAQCCYKDDAPSSPVLLYKNAPNK